MLPQVTAELGLRAADIGLLTGLPPLPFALTALVGALLGATLKLTEPAAQ